MNEIVSRPIKGQALRTLLRDAYVTGVLGVNIDHPDGENFHIDGRYRHFRNRTSVEGTFAIRGDMVCVEGPDVHRPCRRVIDEGDNIYTFIDVPSGSSTRMSVTYPPM